MLESHLRQISGGWLPACPSCGSQEGVLGTENAYWVCGGCGDARYWLEPDQTKGVTWDDAVAASPWGRPSKLAALRRALIKERDALREELAAARLEIAALEGAIRPACAYCMYGHCDDHR